MTISQQPRKTLRGKARVLELAAENERDRLALEDKLVRDLGRGPTPVEAVAIETLSATMIRARKLRSQGRADLEERKLIKQLLSQLDIKTSPTAQPAESMEAYLTRTAGGAR